MTNEEFKDLINEALDITHVILTYGGMATKSIVEDVLIARHEWLGRLRAHEVTNHIEFHNLRPDSVAILAQYPEILRVKRLRLPKYGKPNKNPSAYIEITPGCGRYTVRIARKNGRKKARLYYNVAETWVASLRVVIGEMAGQNGLVVDTDWDMTDRGLTMFAEVDYQLDGTRPTVQWEE